MRNTKKYRLRGYTQYEAPSDPPPVMYTASTPLGDHSSTDYCTEHPRRVPSQSFILSFHPSPSSTVLSLINLLEGGKGWAFWHAKIDSATYKSL